jgi:hypothetical protein
MTIDRDAAARALGWVDWAAVVQDSDTYATPAKRSPRCMQAVALVHLVDDIVGQSERPTEPEIEAPPVKDPLSQPPTTSVERRRGVGP